MLPSSALDTESPDSAVSSPATPRRRQPRISVASAVPEAPFRDLAVGETLVYHHGFLADDRAQNRKLDAVAREALRLSTGVIRQPDMTSAEVPLGAGMLELFQRRQPDGSYVYAARRIR